MCAGDMSQEVRPTSIFLYVIAIFLQNQTPYQLTVIDIADRVTEILGHWLQKIFKKGNSV